MKMTLPYRAALSDTGRWRNASCARGNDRYDDQTRLLDSDTEGGPTRASSDTPQYRRRIARRSVSAAALRG